MTRMIVQSEMDGDTVVVDLLPALPDAWKCGSLTGLSIKGNLKLDINWKDGHFESGKIYSQNDMGYIKKLALIYGGKRYEAPIENGQVNIKNILPTTV